MAQICVLTPQNWVRDDDATLTADSENPEFPVENLLMDQPRERFQAAAGDTDVQVNVTIPAEREINTVALMFANIHNEHASWRLRIAHAGEIATPWYDSARIFGGTEDPHLYALRFTDAAASLTWAPTSFDLSSSFTLEAVVRVWKQAASYTLCRQIPSGGFRWYLDADRRMHIVSPAASVSVSTTESLNDFEWTHVAASYDGAAVRLYINGTLVKTQAATGALGFGASADAEAEGGGLDLAEFRGWTAARSDAEILAAAFAPIADTTGLASYLELAEGTGTTCADTHAGGPGATHSGCKWIWPNRFWASPLLDTYDRTHALWHSTIGGFGAHVRIDIRDEDGDEDAISVGSLILGSGRQPERNFSYGSSHFGVVDPGRRETVATGVTHIQRGASVGSRQLQFFSTSRHEWFQVWHPFLYGLGNSRPFLFVTDPTDPYYAFHGMSLGVFNGPLIPTEDSYRMMRLRTSMLELS